MKASIILIGFNTDKIDESIISYSIIYKYLSDYFNELSNVDIFLFSKSCFSIFLKNGTNIINPSDNYENKKYGYSLLA